MDDKELFKLTDSKEGWIKNLETATEWKLEKVGDNWCLAFPPTNSKIDWKQNFDFWVMPYKCMPHKWFAHRGLVKKYKSVRENILDAVIATGAKILYITGLSQGGAMSILAHEDIEYNLKIECRTTTFGAPRVVSWFAPFTRWYTVKRIEVRGDPVPKVPPFFLGFRHVGACEKIGAFSIPWPYRHADYYAYFRE
jgi:hypothetical protein